MTGALRGLLGAAAPLVLLGYGATLVLDGELSLGAMLAVNAMAVGFLQPLDLLVEAALSLSSLGSYVERLDDVLAAEPEQPPSGIVAPRLSGQHRAPRSVVPLRAERRRWWCAMSACASRPERWSRWSAAPARASPRWPDCCWACTRSGPGHILYDGHDLAGLDLRALRRQLGIVPQHPYVFSGSVRDNLALGDPAVPHERVVAAARRACVHDDIRVHGDGLRHAARRRRRQPVGRAAPAARPGARAGPRTIDPAARRGDQLARRDHRARGDGQPRPAVVHAHRHRAPAEHHRRGRSRSW